MNAYQLDKLLGSKALVPRLSTPQLLYAGTEANEKLRKLFEEKPENEKLLDGKKVAVLSADGVEEIELQGLVVWFKAVGAKVDIVSPAKPSFPEWMGVQFPDHRDKAIVTVHMLENAGWVDFDKTVDQVTADDYDAFLIPGGCWNPDILRSDDKVIKLLKAANEKGKIIGAICHGPLVLVNAELLKGKNATSYWAVQKDIENAGATVTDVEVVVDGNIITSRFPTDLPAFNNSIAKLLLGGK